MFFFTSGPDDVRGKKILITGGITKEPIDGVRHYANYGRPADHGERMALALAAKGAQVTLIHAGTNGLSANGLKIVSTDYEGEPIVTAAQMAACCEREAAAGSYDFAFHLACTGSLQAAQATDRKLKVKTEVGAAVFLDVAPNCDVMAALREHLPVAGYNVHQLLETPSAWGRFIQSYIRSDRIVYGEPPFSSSQREQPLRGRKIIVTSGPTVEQLTTAGDAISNFSTGRQGYEVARALADFGATVYFVSGPTTLPDLSYPDIHTFHVTSAREMLETCLRFLPAAAFVGVAAVADFGCRTLLEPLQPGASVARLELVQNPDILQMMGTHPSLRPSVVVGFAAETHDLAAYALGKLEKKNADVIFANQVGEAMSRRGACRNHVFRVTRDEVFDCGESDKYEVGCHIARFIAGRFALSATPCIARTPGEPR